MINYLAEVLVSEEGKEVGFGEETDEFCKLCVSFSVLRRVVDLCVPLMVFWQAVHVYSSLL